MAEKNSQPDAPADRPYPITIALEGNIGCGKSSVLDRLEESGISVLREPLQEWRDVEGLSRPPLPTRSARASSRCCFQEPGRICLPGCTRVPRTSSTSSRRTQC